jgi:hypothetical protein
MQQKASHSIPRPNLFIIGAMKSGTTSLHNYLNTHPDIFMSVPKELWFFVEEKNWSKGEEWYLEHFRNAGDASIIGESSADYTMFPIFKRVPEKLYAFNPDAKLIYLMRDPVQRAISHYWYDVRTGFEKRPINKALFREKKYLYFSNYAMQIKQYLQLFNRDQMYIATFEEMVRQPAGMVNDILAWLGLEPNSDIPDAIGKSYNATPRVVEQARGLGVLDAIRTSRIWDVLHPMTPKSVIRLGKQIGYRRIDRRLATPQDVLTYLQDQLAPKTSELTGLLCRDFPEWDLDGQETAEIQGSA